MRIELSDPGSGKRLRDYFLRLGAVAELEEDGVVHAFFQDDGLYVAEYLRSWVEANGVPATILPALPVRTRQAA